MKDVVTIGGSSEWCGGVVVVVVVESKMWSP